MLYGSGYEKSRPEMKCDGRKIKKCVCVSGGVMMMGNKNEIGGDV